MGHPDPYRCISGIDGQRVRGVPIEPTLKGASVATVAHGDQPRHGLFQFLLQSLQFRAPLPSRLHQPLLQVPDSRLGGASFHGAVAHGFISIV
jgi:hypothetical protein